MIRGWRNNPEWVRYYAERDALRRKREIDRYDSEAGMFQIKQSIPTQERIAAMAKSDGQKNTPVIR